MMENCLGRRRLISHTPRPILKAAYVIVYASTYVLFVTVMSSVKV